MQPTVSYNPYQHSYSKVPWLSIYIHDELVRQLDHSEYQLDNIPMLESNKTNCFDECPMLSVEFIGHPKFNTWNISNPLLVKIRLIPVLHFPYAKLPSSWPSAIQSLSHLRTPRFWWRFPNIEELSCLLIEDLPSCPMFPSVEVHTRILSLDLVVRYMGFGDPVGRDNYLVFPSNLRLLCIGGCFSTKKVILNFARLKNLERLTLKREFPWGKIEYDCWDFTNVEFPALKYLALHC
ncbi:hypothetical protein BC332_02179 [Capsicum chinense]|nr:hypothetical protein BC332_02179 [Capsicum chinense]